MFVFLTDFVKKLSVKRLKIKKMSMDIRYFKITERITNEVLFQIFKL